MTNEPAYHSGFKRLVRPFNSFSRCSHQARWSISSAAAWRMAARDAGIARRQRLSLVQGLGGHLAGVVDPHQAGRFEALGLARSTNSPPEAGGRPRAGARLVRIRP